MASNETKDQEEIHGEVSLPHTEEESKDENTRETVIKQLRHQVEHYLSEDNLSRDTLLAANLTEDGYISIDTLSEIRLIASLTGDRELLLDAIRSSKKLKMNSQETMVKSIPLVERTTLILRDMPPDVPKKEIMQIFAHPQCGQVKELRCDVGNTWFVKFHTEGECLNTVRYLQSHGTFRDNPLHVRVKSNIYATPPRRSGVPLDVYGSQQRYSGYPFADYGYSYEPYYPVSVMPEGGMDTAIRNGSGSNSDNVRAGRSGGNRRNVTRQRYQAPAPPPQQTSDYPGKFLFYDKEKFLQVWERLRNEEGGLAIPHAMAGRDQVIVSEQTRLPVMIKSQNEAQNKKGRDRRTRGNKRGAARGRGRGRGRGGRDYRRGRYDDRRGGMRYEEGVYYEDDRFGEVRRMRRDVMPYFEEELYGYPEPGPEYDAPYFPQRRRGNRNRNRQRKAQTQRQTRPKQKRQQQKQTPAKSKSASKKKAVYVRKGSQREASDQTLYRPKVQPVS